MKETFIIHAKRTPIGRINGGLSDVRVDDLMSLLIKDFKESINFDPQILLEKTGMDLLSANETLTTKTALIQISIVIK